VWNHVRGEIKFRFAALQKNIVARAKTPGRVGHGSRGVNQSHVARWSGRRIPQAAPRAPAPTHEPEPDARMRRSAARPPDLAASSAMPPQKERRRHEPMKTLTIGPALLAPTSPRPGPPTAQSLCGVREAVVDMLGSAIRRNRAQHRPRRPRPNRGGLRFGGNRVLDHPRHEYRGRGLPRGVRTALRTGGRGPRGRTAVTGWSSPLGLSAAPPPPC
jgi:hypothetical protein